MVWHGFPESFTSFLQRSPVERLLDSEALDDLIERSDSPRPADLR
jgi:hypothetical protein